MHEGQNPATHAVRLGTRGSRLALTQSTQVARALEDAGAPSISLVTVRTQGDGDRTPLRDLGGVGVFAALLRRALLGSQVDLAVHSFKDLPTAPAPGLEVICVPRRADMRDALCARDGLTLEALPTGSRVGTGSPRRAAQLLAVRPDLEVVDLRGNVPTRLARVSGLATAAAIGTDEPVTPAGPDAQGDLDAVVLALAGLRRLGLEHCASQVLDPEVMLPAPAQGALAVEARTGTLEEHEDLARAAARLEDADTRVAVTAERALTAGLEAGCAAPVGAWARVVDLEPETHGPGPARAGTGPAAQENRLATAGYPDVSDPGTAPRRPDLPGTGATARRELVLRALVSSLDGQRRLVRERRVPLPGGQGRGVRPQGSSAPRTTSDLVAAENLGARVASVLLEDGAGELSDLQARRPEHPPEGSGGLGQD
ncbi:hydroxymethylbilane synthase [Actinomyces sp. 2119]|uniref:hydroxymethylbilane synthase n=1 Tax=Actinomyces sp. 2119 TaxID=2321393 RepID=UPI000E6C9BC6|nr:hydroxymethylbilane synthase [Actinomyces sp. 2119]RJF41193.1 hydroxymethylbilane synthase [Actinomyces sp. 2119]